MLSLARGHGPKGRSAPQQARNLKAFRAECRGWQSTPRSAGRRAHRGPAHGAGVSAIFCAIRRSIASWMRPLGWRCTQSLENTTSGSICENSSGSRPSSSNSSQAALHLRAGLGRHLADHRDGHQVGQVRFAEQGLPIASRAISAGNSVVVRFLMPSGRSFLLHLPDYGRAGESFSTLFRLVPWAARPRRCAKPRRSRIMRVFINRCLGAGCIGGLAPSTRRSCRHRSSTALHRSPPPMRGC